MDETTTPLFQQIATLIEDSIVDGTLRPGARSPSMNELACFHSVNPATARKGLALLVERGVLEKKRGMGMYVTDNAQEEIVARRSENFAADFLAPLIDEAVTLSISRAQLHDLLDRVAESRGLYR